MEPSITTTHSRRLRRISLALSLVFACFLSATVLAKETEAEKAAKAAAAQEKLLQVFVTEPYLELSTGPGRGYPVFHVVEREASVDVLYRRTDWFKVRDENGVEGWARANDLRRTRLADGSPFIFNLGDRAGFTSHDWELGLGGGDYGGANLISVYGAYSLTDNMKVELTGCAVPGQRLEGLQGRARSHPRDFPRMAAVAVPGAGHRHRVHRAARHHSSARRPHRPDGVCGRGHCVFISPGVSSSAPTIAGTRFSRAAMTIRSWKNGKF